MLVMKKKTIIKGYIIIVFFIILPLLTTLMGGLLDIILGCEEVPGGIPKCLVFGYDLGNLVGNLYLTHWFFISTLIYGFIAIIIWTIIVVVNLIGMKKN